MKKMIAVACVCLLAACQTTPKRGVEVNSNGDITVNGKTLEKAPPPKMPALPKGLAQKAGRLPILTDKTVPGMQKDAIETDKQYNLIAHQVNSIIDAWECVRKNLNDGEDASKCLKE